MIPGCWLPRSNDRDTWVEFRYERLEDFCYNCGRIGHVNSECSLRPNGSGAAGYGEWMKTAAVRDIQEVNRPVVSFQGERRLAGTTREVRRG